MLTIPEFSILSEDFIPESNIRLSDLKGNVTEYIPSVMKRSGSLMIRPPSVVYVFFPYNEKDLHIKLRHIPGVLAYINLRKSDYGMPLEDLLEDASALINNGIEYDVELCLSKIRDLINPSATKLKKIESYLRSGRYEPSGQEVLKGICSESGFLIRSYLNKLELPDSVKFIEVTSTNPHKLGRFGLSHDTTLVFDNVTGSWIVINSKSPIKHYNVVPKGKLADLGYPYVK
ncbi:hypothetical protein J4405_03870 [Candidatus Woesearchaeota archaeon]|nr:hypothetical protein [uncultured archaeon]MBS3141256.1 hypothetical protein [Candidatus Woesearchaeota archaeon]